MNYSDLAKHYREHYNNDCYTNDSSGDSQRLLKLFDVVDNLSAASQKEFAKKFSFDFALDGVVYVGTQRGARIDCPNLIIECPEICHYRPIKDGDNKNENISPK